MVPYSRRTALCRLGAGILATLSGCVSTVDSDSPTTTAPTSTVTGPTSTTTTTSTHTGSSGPQATSVTPDGSTADWQVTFNGDPRAPVYGNGLVLVGTDAGALYALDAATGEQAWARLFEQSIQGGPIVANRRVYFVTGTYGLGGTPTARGVSIDGSEPWGFTHEAPSGSRASLSVIGATVDGVYLGSNDDVREASGESLYALAPDGRGRWTGGIGDVRDGSAGVSGVYVTTRGRLDAFGTAGEKRWTFDAPRPKAPALGRERVYANAGEVASGQYLHAFDAVTGERLWRFDPWRAHSTAVVDGVVYSGGDRLTRLDPATGERIWTVEQAHWVNRDATPVASSTVYAGGETVAAYAIDDGTRHWTFNGTAEFFRVVGVTDDTVFVLGRDGLLHALVAPTGQQRWSVPTPDGPPAIGNSRAFVTIGDALVAIPIETAAN